MARGHHPEAGQAENVWSDCCWQDLLEIYFIGKQTRLFCSSNGWDTWRLFYLTCVCECVVQGIYVCVSVGVCIWVSMWVSLWSQRSVLGLLQSISTLIFEMCSLTLLEVIYPARPDRLVCAWGYVRASSFSRVFLMFAGWAHFLIETSTKTKTSYNNSALISLCLLHVKIGSKLNF